MAEGNRQKYMDSFIENWYDIFMEYYDDFNSKRYWKFFTKLIANIPLQNVDPSLTPKLMRTIALGEKLHRYLLYYMRADCPQCVQENETDECIDGLHRYCGLYVRNSNLLYKEYWNEAMHNMKRSVMERMLQDSLVVMIKALSSKELTKSRKLWLVHVTEEDLEAAVKIENECSFRQFQFDPMLKTFTKKVIMREDMYPDECW